MQDERDKIDAERAENQRMMQELLALKAQLEQKSGEETPPAESASEATPLEQVTTDETVVETTEIALEDTLPTETTDENQ